MAVMTKSQLDEPRVFIRGDMRQPGEAVPRRFLQVLSDVDDRCYEDDGRLQMARAIASPKNPLTARVIVNRVWHHHFGAGLVSSLDDFGENGESPSHPQLLDHLATWLVDHGWSLKALHLYLMSSQTWQQSSTPQPLAIQLDPDNRMVWRMSPRQLEFEPLRDSLLFVAGRLDTSLGGRSTKLDESHVRRALYGFTDRFQVPAGTG